MSVLIDTVLANSASGGTEKLVLVVLARGANQRGYTRLPVRLIAALCNRSEASVRESLEKLAERREIERVEMGGGKAKATTWQIVLERKRDLPDLKIPAHDHDWQPPF